MRTAEIAGTMIAFSLLYGAPATAVDFDPGFYTGLSLGLGTAADICSGVESDCNDEEFSYKILAGYQFSKWISVEASYLDLGETRVTIVADTIRKSVDGFSAAVVGTAPGIEKAGLFGKFGVYYASVKYSGTDNGMSLSFDDEDFAAFVGVAARYPLGESLGLSLEWERYFDVGKPNSTQRSIVTESNHSVFSATLLYHF